MIPFLRNPVINTNLGLAPNTGYAPAMLQLLLRNIINFAFGIAGLWFFFQLIIGGYNYLTAGGDKEAVLKAQKRLQNAVIGLLIVVAVFTLTNVVEQFFGTSFTRFNIPTP